MDESKVAATPTVVYGLNLLAAAAAYFVLQGVIIRRQGPDSPLRQAIGSDTKGKVSLGVGIAGVLSALVIDRAGHLGAGIAMGCFIVVAIIWIVPDRRIDRAIREHQMTS